LSGTSGPNDRDDLVLLDQLACGGDRLGLVGSVIFDDDLDLSTVDSASLVDALHFHLDRLLLRFAEASVGSRERHDRTDLYRLSTGCGLHLSLGCRASDECHR